MELKLEAAAAAANKTCVLTPVEQFNLSDNGWVVICKRCLFFFCEHEYRPTLQQQGRNVVISG